MIFLLVTSIRQVLTWQIWIPKKPQWMHQVESGDYPARLYDMSPDMSMFPETYMDMQAAQNFAPTPFQEFGENSFQFPEPSYVDPSQGFNAMLPEMVPNYEPQFFDQAGMVADLNSYRMGMPPAIDQSTNIYSPSHDDQDFSMNNSLYTPMYPHFSPDAYNASYGDMPYLPQVNSQPEMVVDQQEETVASPSAESVIFVSSESVTGEPETPTAVSTSKNLTESLTLLSKHIPHMLILDISTYVNRGNKQRLREDVHKDGTVKAPLNAFNLYVKAYKALTDELIRLGFIENTTRLPTTQYATKVIGLSWQMESQEIRAKYRELAVANKEKYRIAFSNHEEGLRRSVRIASRPRCPKKRPGKKSTK